MITATASPSVSHIVLPPSRGVAVQQQSHGLVFANNLAWVPAKVGALPQNAIAVVLADNKIIYVCNVKAYGGMHPGQLSQKGCTITYNGAAVAKKQFNVLAGSASVVWRSPDVINQDEYASQVRFYGILPQGLDVTSYVPIIGGYESQYPNYLHPLYICQTLTHNSIRIGKVVGDRCNVAVNGREVMTNSYMILSAMIRRGQAVASKNTRPTMLN